MMTQIITNSYQKPINNFDTPQNIRGDSQINWQKKSPVATQHELSEAKKTDPYQEERYRSKIMLEIQVKNQKRKNGEKNDKQQ